MTPMENAINQIKSGNTVVMPTGTIWGILCRADRDDAVEKLLAQKHRAPGKGRLLMNVADMGQIEKIAVVGDLARHLIEKYMPGGLTLVLPMRVGAVLSQHVVIRDTVAVRIPEGEIIGELLRGAGLPLVSTSANITDDPPVENADAARATFPDAFVFDTGEPLIGEPSTLAEVVDGKVEILRQGGVVIDELTIKN